MSDGTPIRRRRAAKYVRGGFRQCYLCLSEPDEIHHTSYFPEEAVALCETCHRAVHNQDMGSHLEPDRSRPEGYETTRRQQEKEGVYRDRSWIITHRMKLEANSHASQSMWGAELPHPDVERGEHL